MKTILGFTVLVVKPLQGPPTPPQFPQQFSSSPTSASNRSLMKSLDLPLVFSPPPRAKMINLTVRASINSRLINNNLAFPSDPAVGAEPGEV